MERNNILSDSPWEPIIGYSRLVKCGQQVFILGTTSIDEKGNVVGEEDSYLQTRHIIQIIQKYFKKINANLINVVRTRIYVIDIEEWKFIGKAHAEAFKDIQPTSTMVEVKRLIRPELLIKIEADVMLE